MAFRRPWRFGRAVAGLAVVAALAIAGDLHATSLALAGDGGAAEANPLLRAQALDPSAAWLRLLARDAVAYTLISLAGAGALSRVRTTPTMGPPILAAAMLAMIFAKAYAGATNYVIALAGVAPYPLAPLLAPLLAALGVAEPAAMAAVLDSSFWAVAVFAAVLVWLARRRGAA